MTHWEIRWWRIWLNGWGSPQYREVSAPTAELALAHLRHCYPALDLSRAEVGRI